MGLVGMGLLVVALAALMLPSHWEQIQHGEPVHQGVWTTRRLWASVIIQFLGFFATAAALLFTALVYRRERRKDRDAFNEAERLRRQAEEDRQDAATQEELKRQPRSYVDVRAQVLGSAVDPQERHLAIEVELVSKSTATIFLFSEEGEPQWADCDDGDPGCVLLVWEVQRGDLDPWTAFRASDRAPDSCHFFNLGDRVDPEETATASLVLPVPRNKRCVAYFVRVRVTVSRYRPDQYDTDSDDGEEGPWNLESEVVVPVSQSMATASSRSR
jgi:hypothetical protein